MKEKKKTDCCTLSFSIITWPSWYLVLQMLKYVAELTLVPSGDEILPVRSQEL